MAQNKKSLSFILEELKSGYFNDRYLGHEIENEIKTELFEKVYKFVENFPRYQKTVKKVCFGDELTQSDKQKLSFFASDLLDIFDVNIFADDEQNDDENEN